MTQLKLCENAEQMAGKIAQASSDERLLLQPEFNLILTNLKLQGVNIPVHLRNLNARLTDEVVEARLDNLPV